MQNLTKFPGNKEAAEEKYEVDQEKKQSKDIQHQEWIRDIYQGNRAQAIRGLVIGTITSLLLWIAAMIYFK